MAGDPIPGWLTYRVVTRNAELGNQGKVVISDLPHPHQSSWQIGSFQPGAAAMTALGRFQIPLHPPSSKDEYAAAADRYSLLQRGQRIEAYTSPSPNQAALRFAGIITRIRRNNSQFVIEGSSDLLLLHAARVFPGEKFYPGGTVYYASELADVYSALPEATFGDDFDPYVSGNYSTVTTPGGVAGSWSANTDNVTGLPSVYSSTGTGNILLSTTSVTATDASKAFYAAVSGTLNVDSSVANGATMGIIGIFIGTDANNGFACYINPLRNTTTGNADITCAIDRYSGGVLLGTDTNASVLSVPMDANNGALPFTVEVYAQQNQGTVLTFNGTHALAITPFPGATAKIGPIFSRSANAGGSVHIVQLGRLDRYGYNNDNTGAAFTRDGGLSGTTTNGIDVGPSHLEMILRAANATGSSLRYDPVPMAAGSRHLGRLGLSPSVTDWSSQFEFTEEDNLVDLDEDNASDGFATMIDLSAGVSASFGGAARWFDFAAMQTYGVLMDAQLQLSAQDFGSARAAARNVTGIVSGAAPAQTATVLRDPTTVDRWRELDVIRINAPSRGIQGNAVIVGYDYTEGSTTQRITLQAFPFSDFRPTAQRLFPGLEFIAATFKTR